MSAPTWFATRLTTWYNEHKRSLPWRSTKDPYRVWLSEVILQQTRVDQGLPYYERFVTQYPTVGDLATASQDEVLKLWQGLGYYSRARNLHAAAGTVHQHHNSQFPTTKAKLKELNGIGDYTAAAIASICFNEPVAVVDGNVYRVLARVFGIDTPIDGTDGRKQFSNLAGQLLDRSSPGDHNQAVMEFGATHCTPKKPACTSCIFADHCAALATGKVQELPVKKGRTKQRDRFFNYLIIRDSSRILFEQRRGKGIWQGLFQFPLIETDRKAGERTVAKALNLDLEASAKVSLIAEPPPHILSHQRIHARFWHCSNLVSSRLFLGRTGYNYKKPETLQYLGSSKNSWSNIASEHRHLCYL